MKSSQARWLLVVVGTLLWMLAVYPAYYIVHKPLIGEPALARPTISLDVKNVASAVLSLLADPGLLALTLAVVAAWGSRIGRWLGLAFESGLERWTLGAILGLGLLGTVVFGLGVVGGLYRWVGYGILLALGLAAWPEIRALIHWLATRVHQVRFTRASWLWLYTCLVGFFSLGLAFLPPTGWDALVYHLQGPRLYLEAHRLVAVPENLYLNWPAQVEMLFLWGLLLKGDTLAQLFHWTFWALTAALLYVLARRVIGVRAGPWAVALWASIPFASELAGMAYVDLGLTAFALAAVYAFLRWTDQGSNGWLALAALFSGLAMATKYTAITWVAALVLLLVCHAVRHQRRPLGWIVLYGAGFAVVAGLIVIPWLAKNWIVTGNPVYPFLFGGKEWNSTRQAFLAGTGGGYSRNPLDYLALPWLATVLGSSGTAAFDATIGPLLLCLVPLVFLVRGRPRAINYSLVLVGGQIAFFIATIYTAVYLVETRLLLPAFPLLCLAAAYALDQLPRWDRRALRLSRVVGGVVTVVLALNLLAEAHAFWAVGPLAPLVGLESREGYLLRRLGAHYYAMRYVNQELPANSRLFFLWEPRSYYCSPPAQSDPTLDNLAQLRLAYGDAETALAALRAQGFTHLLFYRAGLGFLQEPSPRPPTLSSLAGQPPPDRSYYPLTDDDSGFLAALLAGCQQTSDMAGIYEIYQLP